MALTVTDTRTTIVEGDSTDSGTWNSGTYVTVSYAEATGSRGLAINIGSGGVYNTQASTRNLTDTLVYVWSSNVAIQTTWTSGEHSLVLGSGTNILAIHQAGGDRMVFSHLSGGRADWQSLLIDTSQIPTRQSSSGITVIGGSYASFNVAAVDIFGGYYITQSKAIGGGYNVFVDIIRIGNNGLVIKGGTSGDQGKFSEITTLDSSTTNQRAHGIIHEYTQGIYGIQGPLTFGDTTGVSYFSDNGITLAFENRYIANDKYYLALNAGSGTGNETHFTLTNSIITSAGPYALIDFDANNVNTLEITGCTFSALGNQILFGNDVSAENHQITQNTFQGCGQINPGKTQFTDNTIAGTTAGSTGAILLDADGSSTWANLTFISGGTGHAIYITATGTYTFDNFTYSGYGATGTTDAAVYNNSGGVVAINVVGGDSPTYRNGSGSSTTINAAVNLAVTVKDEAGANIQNARVSIETINPVAMTGAVADDGGSQTNETTAANNATANDMTLLPTTPAVNDAYYFGSNEPFSKLRINIGQNGAGTWTVDWQYYNASWTLIPGFVDETDGFRAGTGNRDVNFSPPSDWTTTPVSGILAYWVRAVVTSYTSVTTPPLGTQSWIFQQIMNKLTDVNGLASESYNYLGSADVSVKIRKSSASATKYVPANTTQTITSAGLSLTWIMITDAIAAP